MEYQKIIVGICDDDKNIQNIIYNFLDKYQIGTTYEFDIYVYSSGEILLQSVSNVNCDLLFLDIELGGINGIEVSHILRNLEERENLQIVFISSHDKYMREMFNVRPFQYLSKPLSETDLTTTLNTFMKLHRIKSTVFCFKKGKTIYRLPYSDIIYFESCGRKIVLYTTYNTHTFYGKLDELESNPTLTSFYRIHQSYMINPAYVTKYSPTYLILKNNIKISISAKFRSKFIQMQLDN